MSKRSFEHSYTTPKPKRARIQNDDTAHSTPAGSARSLTQSSPRLSATPSAFDTFPAQAFNEFVQSIKSKAKRALRENEAADIERDREQARLAEKARAHDEKQALLIQLLKAREEEAEAALEQAIEEARRPIAAKRPPSQALVQNDVVDDSDSEADDDSRGSDRTDEDDDGDYSEDELAQSGKLRRHNEYADDDDDDEEEESEDNADDLAQARLEAQQDAFEIISSDDDEIRHSFRHASKSPNAEADHDPPFDDDDQECDEYDYEDEDDGGNDTLDQLGQGVGHYAYDEEADDTLDQLGQGAKDYGGITETMIDPALQPEEYANHDASDKEDGMASSEPLVTQFLPASRTADAEAQPDATVELDAEAEATSDTSPMDAVPEELIPVFDDDDEGSETNSAIVNEAEDRYDNEPEEDHLPIDLLIERGDELSQQDVLSLQSPAQNGAAVDASEHDAEPDQMNLDSTAVEDVEDIEEIEESPIDSNLTAEEMLFKEMDKARRLSHLDQPRPDMRRLSNTSQKADLIMAPPDRPAVRRSSETPREDMRAIFGTAVTGLPPRRRSDAKRTAETGSGLRPSLRPKSADSVRPSIHHSIEEHVAEMPPAEVIVEDEAEVVDATEKGFHVARSTDASVLAVQDKAVEMSTEAEVPVVTEQEAVHFDREEAFLERLDESGAPEQQFPEDATQSTMDQTSTPLPPAAVTQTSDLPIHHSVEESTRDAAPPAPIMEDREHVVDATEKGFHVARDSAQSVLAVQDKLIEHPESTEVPPVLEHENVHFEQEEAYLAQLDAEIEPVSEEQDLLAQDKAVGIPDELILAPLSESEGDLSDDEADSPMQGDLADFIAEDKTDAKESLGELVDAHATEAITAQSEGAHAIPDIAEPIARDDVAKHNSDLADQSGIDGPQIDTAKAEQESNVGEDAVVGAGPSEHGETAVPADAEAVDLSADGPIRASPSAEADVPTGPNADDVEDGISMDGGAQESGEVVDDVQESGQAVAGVQGADEAACAVQAEISQDDPGNEDIEAPAERLQTPPPVDNPEEILHSQTRHPSTPPPVPVVVHRLRDGAEYVDDGHDLSLLAEHDESHHHLPEATLKSPSVKEPKSPEGASAQQESGKKRQRSSEGVRVVIRRSARPPREEALEEAGEQDEQEEQEDHESEEEADEPAALPEVEAKKAASRTGRRTRSMSVEPREPVRRSSRQR